MQDTTAVPLIASTEKGILKFINKIAALTHQIKLKKKRSNKLTYSFS